MDSSLRDPKQIVYIDIKLVIMVLGMTTPLFLFMYLHANMLSFFSKKKSTSSIENTHYFDQ